MGNYHIIRHVVLLVSILALVACEGNGSQDTSTPPIDNETPSSMVAVNDSYTTPFQSVLSDNVSGNDTPSTNTPDSWELVSQTTNGIIDLTGVGAFTYTPSGGYSGGDSFTYRIRDSLNNLSNVATATITVQAQQVASTCDVLYANNGGFSPVTSQTVMAIPNIPKPDKGVHFLDPNYGTCVVRVSDHANDSDTIANRIVPDYSRRQVFNADQSRMLLLASDGFWHLYDANDYSHIRRVSLQGDSVEFQWHPTDPNLLYRMAFNGGRQIYLHDVSDTTDNTASVVADFTNVSAIDRYAGVTNINDTWPNATAF